MQDYDPKEIEAKWQKIWAEKGTYEAKNDSSKPKWYSLIEFPYPSGEGLHVGHPRPYIAMDIISRKRRMQGYNVLYPIGWDAFGLQTENFALKTHKQPAVITKENTDTFRRQIQNLAISFDWSREINTTDPKYYKWTQWLFLKFLEHDLAYKAKMNINWCPKDKIGLANEEVIDGKCERCGTVVEKREKEQWMLRITKYADRLDKDLDTVDYPERVKTQQRNWIGRSEGALIKFGDIEVFTTRPDTIFGATFVAVAPEVAKKLTGNDFGIVAETDRESKEKKGVDTGLKVTNPATKEQVSVWVVNYVSADYGTGAIMGVPADDERDREFALKFNLPIVENYTKAGFEDFGTKVTKFKLRDWIFSRQRYWGEPIPVIHCEKCGVVPVPEKDLPVTLPEVPMYEPTDTGESPLATIDSWVNVECPKCGGMGKRETDTMPNWAGSSWYFLRYADPHNDKEFASMEALKYWMPVDWYNGGMEHTTLHLLYSRFWNKFFFDIGLVPTSEPYKKRTSHGLILAEGGEKMSKSKGNVVNPDTIVNMFGADTLRVYEMFMGPFEQAIAWSEASLIGPRRFLERVWKLATKVSETASMNTEDERMLNESIKKVGGDIEVLGFNTAVSNMMIYSNYLDAKDVITKSEYENLLKLLAPFAPHITEELWETLGQEGSVHEAPWPTFDESKLVRSRCTLAIQVNGRVRATLETTANATENEVKAAALALPEVEKWLNGAIPKKVVVVLGKVVNIVV
ncbi:MAG: leuS [Parcubacteria group bacterium]|nr:leuS [Parcubacteria group bacterium]